MPANLAQSASLQSGLRLSYQRAGVKRRQTEIGLLRAVAGVAGGLFTWVVVATVGNLLLRVVWPSYAEVEVVMNFTPAMLVMRLLLGALSSLCAGFLAG